MSLWDSLNFFFVPIFEACLGENVMLPAQKAMQIFITCCPKIKYLVERCMAIETLESEIRNGGEHAEYILFKTLRSCCSSNMSWATLW